jgi:hypothetical protein
MYTTPHHPPHALSSVGALMDPGFLRQVVHDAEEQGFSAEPVLPAPAGRLRTAVQVFASACLRRIAPH